MDEEPKWQKNGQGMCRVWSEAEKQILRDTWNLVPSQIVALGVLPGRSAERIGSKRTEMGLAKQAKAARKAIPKKRRIHSKRYDKPADSYRPPQARFASVWDYAQGDQK